jgi:hypothetical protein
LVVMITESEAIRKFASVRIPITLHLHCFTLASAWSCAHTLFDDRVTISSRQTVRR